MREQARNDVSKGPLAFRTISETADTLGVPQHVLRFWETKFAFIRPTKRAGGRRFYRPQDIDLLMGVKALLHDRGYTIRGVQMLFKDEGVKALLNAGRGGAVSAPEPVVEDDDFHLEPLSEAPARTARAPLPKAARHGADDEPVFDFDSLKDLPIADGLSEDTRQRLLAIAQALEAAQAQLSQALKA